MINFGGVATGAEVACCCFMGLGLEDVGAGIGFSAVLLDSIGFSTASCCFGSGVTCIDTYKLVILDLQSKQDLFSFEFLMK